MSSFPRPTSVPTLRSFLGLVNYYRRFVSHFALLAAPLYALTEKTKIWEWSDECEQAFIQVKHALVSAPILRAPDPELKFVLQTDASDIGLGAVLSQRDHNADEWVIAYASRSLRKAEKNYHTTEKECLAIIFGVKQFRSYLWGLPFIVETDHSALSWLYRMKEPTGRLARWIMYLQEYDVTIIHRPGRLNGNADALSRAVHIAAVTRSRTLDIKGDEEIIPKKRTDRNKRVDKSEHDLKVQDEVEKREPSLIDVTSTNSIAESVMNRRGRGVGPYYADLDEKEDPVEEWEEWSEAIGTSSAKKNRQRDKGMNMKGTTKPTPRMDQTHNYNQLSVVNNGSANSGDGSGNNGDVTYSSPIIDTNISSVLVDNDVSQNDANNSDLSEWGLESQQTNVASGVQAISMADRQHSDPECSALLTYLNNGTVPDAASGMKQMVLEQANECRIRDGVLMNVRNVKRGKRETMVERIYLPRSLRQAVLKECHDGYVAGHLGMDRTYKTLQDRFYWPGMYADTEAWVKGCSLCGGGKAPAPLLSVAPIGTLPVPTSPFEIVSVDVMGPLQPTPRGNRYILVFTDFLTRWPEAVALPNQEAKTIARALVEQVVCRHGAPAVLLSDRGSPFKATLAEAVYDLLAIDKRSTTAYRPQCNGKTERFNKVLATILKMYVAEDQTNWDEWLPYALLAYRCAYHEVLKESPFYLVYGRQPRLPIDLALHTPSDHFANTDEWLNTLHTRFDRAHALAVEALKDQNNKREEQNRDIHAPVYAAGSRVYLYFPQVKRKRTIKLAHRWTGPWVVKRQVTPVQYEVELEVGGRKQMVHVTRMKPYISRDDMHRLNSIAQAAASVVN
jgi:hypothetical protein